MLNQTVLVGRLVRDPEIKEIDDGTKVSNITIAVPRPYKNSNGGYDTDFINCSLWRGIAENTVEYCKKGDLIGIKGCLRQDDNKLTVVAERVTFLSTNKETESIKGENKDLEV